MVMSVLQRITHIIKVWRIRRCVSVKRACDFYHELRKRGIYINSPDNYYLNGSNKCGMGYRETNFSLPRERQILIARQNIYDGTYEKTPSMGWMFVFRW